MKTLVKEINKKTTIWVFIAVIIVQLASLIYLSYEKQAFFIDEIYSYIYANSYDCDSIPNDETLYNQWVNGSDFNKLTTVQENEKFSYNRTYYNSSKDQHPPLYYFLLHTVCSLFPNVLSKWTGLTINIILFIALQVIMFMLSRKIFGNNLWSIIPVALYGSSLYAINTVVFIRMYMLAALFTVAISLIHIIFLTRRLNFLDYLLCYFVVFLGTFTIYIFAIYAFFIAAATCIYLLSKKRIKELLGYAISMLLGIATVFAVFPVALNQLTGKGNYGVGKEIARSAFSLSELPSHILSYVQQIFYSVIAGILEYKYAVLIVVLASGVIAILIGKKEKKDKRKDERLNKELLGYTAIIGFMLICTLIATALLSGKFSYDRYLYNVIPIGCLFVSLLIYCLASVIRMKKGVIAIGILAISIISIFTLASNQSGSFIYSDSKTDQIVEDCGSKPLIVISNNSAAFPTGNYNVISKCNQIYMTKSDEFDIDNTLSGVNTEKGVAFMILTDTYWGQGYEGEKTISNLVNATDKLSNYQKYSDCFLGEIYFAD